MKDFKKLLNAFIQKDRINWIKIGTKYEDIIFELKKIEPNSEYWTIDHFYYDHGITIKILDSIYLFFRKDDNKLFRILLWEKFSGTYNGVGIGNTVADLKQVCKITGYDDDYIQIDNDWSLQFVADEDMTYSGLSENDKDAAIIEQIIIELR